MKKVHSLTFGSFREMSEEILYFTHVLFQFNHQKHTKRINEHRHILVH